MVVRAPPSFRRYTEPRKARTDPLGSPSPHSSLAPPDNVLQDQRALPLTYKPPRSSMRSGLNVPENTCRSVLSSKYRRTGLLDAGAEIFVSPSRNLFIPITL